MSKRKIIMMAVALVAVGAVAAYKMLGQSGPDGKPPKVAGPVYVLPKEFLVNLSDSRWAKVNVALVLRDDAPFGASDAAHQPPADGYGNLPQEALVRSIVTDTLTGKSGHDLLDRQRRHGLKRTLLRKITDSTDVPAETVLLTDLAVQ